MQYRRAVPVLALVAVVACQHDRPTQPTAKANSTPSAANPARADGPQRVLSPYALSITDASSGKTWTFDPVTNTIQSDSLTVVIDDDSLAAATYTEFAGTPLTDAQDNSLYAAATSGGGRQKPIPTVSGHQGRFSGFLWQHRQLPITRVHPASLGLGITIPAEFGVGAGLPMEPALLQGLFNCTSVANAIVENHTDWVNSQRTQFFSTLWDNWATEAVDHVLHLVKGAATAVDFASQWAQRQYVRVSVGLEAAVWNDYNCNNKTVVSSEILLLGSATGGGSDRGAPNEVCEYDWWSISFDDGATWTGFYVWTCYIRST